jgi:DNA gyrase subunit A
MSDENINDEVEFNHGKITDINIDTEMRTSYLSYAMSVIVSRALPDVKDGLKPVQRRIIYAMHRMGVDYSSKTVKCAKIVGDVMGNYHPHGDASIYDSLVKLAQDFYMGRKLVEGQGNFGSIDGDGAAASRYTEAKLAKISNLFVDGIDKDTVDFTDNYDATEKEPVVLPTSIPNILVNGTNGIAVGMATSMPPHNLRECLEAAQALLDDPDLSFARLIEIIKGPDFPTGAEILGLGGLYQAYETGRGTFKVRSKVSIEKNEKTGKNSLVITEIPYLTNKSDLIDSIVKVVKDGTIDGIVGISDHSSNKSGISIVVDLKKDVNAEVIVNNLYKHSSLQKSFSINNVVLVNGRPEQLSLKRILELFLEFQVEILVRKSRFELKKAKERLHILEALYLVPPNLEEIVMIIKNSEDNESAKLNLRNRFSFSEEQVKAITELRLRQLTNIETHRIIEEKETLEKRVIELNLILSDSNVQKDIIRQQLEDIKNSFTKVGDRKTVINSADDSDIDDENLIPKQDIIVLLSKEGYIKRILQNDFRTQARGGIGIVGIKTYEKDFLNKVEFTNSHHTHFFFTSFGRVYKIKGYKIPLGSREAKGLPIINLFPTLQEGEKIVSLVAVDGDPDDKFFVFSTKKGIIKICGIDKFKNVNKLGIRGIVIRDNDELLDVKVAVETDDLLLASSGNKVIRFNIKENVREIGRAGQGVKGMTLAENDEVIGMDIMSDSDAKVLCIKDDGIGKLCEAKLFKSQRRGGSGVIAIKSKSEAKLKIFVKATVDQDVLVVTDRGLTLRTPIKDITALSRYAVGFKLISLRNDHKITAATILPHEDSTRLNNLDSDTPEE